MEEKKIILKFGQWYGLNGIHVYQTVMPGILQDFKKMAREANGKPVEEEYHLEDGKGILKLSGFQMGRETKIEVECIDPERK